MSGGLASVEELGKMVGVEKTPLPPHAGEAIDIAYGYLYLACDESRFVTGEELVIDGGRLSLNATGTELPVYVDPRNPYDAILVPGGSTQHQAAFVGGVLMVIGALFAVLGGALVAVALALPPG